MGNHEKTIANSGGPDEPKTTAWDNVGDVGFHSDDGAPDLTPPPLVVKKDSFKLLMKCLTDESDPLLQLDNIHTMSKFLKHTHLGDGAAREFSSELDAVSKKDNSPLVKLGIAYLRDCIDIDYSGGDKQKIKMSEYYIKDLLNQEQLHSDYPALPDFSVVVRMAPNIAYSLDDYNDMKNTALRGASKTIQESTNPSEDPFLTLLDHNEQLPVWVLSFAHDLRFRGLIEEKIGLNLADISLDAQVQLLKFMTEANDKRFDRLCSALHGTDKKVRLKLAEGFLAADFGEDFGDALLDIAESERINDKQLGEILGKMSSCRESIRDITELYYGFDDGNFTQEYARAANERLTDAITVFREIAKCGVAEADLGWPGRVRYDYRGAMEALEYETKSLEIISGVVNDVMKKKEGAFAEVVLPPDETNMAHARTLYNLYSPSYGYVLLHTRPKGSHSFDSTIEHGKKRSPYDRYSVNAGTEASISFTVDPVNTNSLPNPYLPDYRAISNPFYYDATKMNKVSALRIDREGRSPGWEANDPRRDPLNLKGMVSVDLAAIGDRADTPSGKIARLISVGNSLRAEVFGKETSLNHNTNWFDQEKYGTEPGFARVVAYLDSIVNGWCKSRPPKYGEGFTGSMQQLAKRKRGRRAARPVA